MKKTKSQTAQLIICTFLMCGLLFSSCKKGDTGPEGPAGTNGTNGTNGKDGNANVKSTTIFINANEWIYTAGEANVTKLVPEITADIVSKGTVQIYMEDTPGEWVALPTTVADPSLIMSIGYSVLSGKLNVLVTFNANVVMPAGTLTSSNFKVVTIAGAAKVANPGGSIPQAKTAILD